MGSCRTLNTTLIPGNYSFWARVTDATSATINTSARISVAITAAVAATPVPLRIMSQSHDMAYSITDANKVITLKVEATGGTKPYTYAWYRGDCWLIPVAKSVLAKKQNLSSPLGPYAYWARVTDFASNTIDSAAVNVVITPLRY
jgi:hypothetical protein